MKKILVLLLGMIISTSIHAHEQEKLHGLCLDFIDGGRIVYILPEKPQVTMPEDLVRVYVDGPNMIDESFKRTDLKRFYFELVSPDDKDIHSDVKAISENRVAFKYIDGENVHISGLKDKTKVSVASLDGKIISTQKSDGAGSVTISLGNQPKGIYIISFGGRSVKIQH